MFRQGVPVRLLNFTRPKHGASKYAPFVTRLMLFFELISVTAFIGIFRYMVVFYYKNVE